MAIVPKARPEIARATAAEWLTPHIDGPRWDHTPMILGRRGYYRDTMGVAGKNDRGIYDDAIVLIGPNVYATFNANTDPSIKRPRVAVLRAGVWQYKLGIHNVTKDPKKHPRYPALIQAGEVVVDRDDVGEDRGWFGINIHKGSRTTTSSEGCQTIHPDQWEEFYGAVKATMTAHTMSTIPYVLTVRADI